MAEQHAPIDLRTLEDVQHLLATTTFASIDDVARRAGDPARSDSMSQAPATRSRDTVVVDSSGLAPLPRRR